MGLKQGKNKRLPSVAQSYFQLQTPVCVILRFKLDYDLTSGAENMLTFI